MDFSQSFEVSPLPAYRNNMVLNNSNKDQITCDFNTTHLNNFQTDLNCVSVNPQGYQTREPFCQLNQPTFDAQQWGGDCSFENENIARRALEMNCNAVKGQQPQCFEGGLPKRFRTTFSPSQLNRLESEFQCNNYVVGLKRMKLAEELKLEEKQVKIWFQNKRMKIKRERQSMQRKLLANKAQYYLL